MKPRAISLADFALDPMRTCEDLRMVGLTPQGAVPLVLEGAGRRPTAVRLPGVAGGGFLEPPERLRDRFRERLGLDAEELLVMSRYGIPTGERGRATILLAPRVDPVPPPPPGLEFVPLPDLGAWLAARKREGARVDLMVRVGLLLAGRHFARWARTILRSQQEGFRARSSPRVPGSLPEPMAAR
jgi:hypothetical protein